MLQQNLLSKSIHLAFASVLALALTACGSSDDRKASAYQSSHDHDHSHNHSHEHHQDNHDHNHKTDSQPRFFGTTPRVAEDNPIISSVRYDGDVTNLFFGDKASPFAARFLRFNPNQLDINTRANFQTTRLSGAITGHTTGLVESLNGYVITYENILDKHATIEEDKEQSRLSIWQQQDINKPARYLDALYVDSMCKGATESIVNGDTFIFACPSQLMSITITDRATAKQLETAENCGAKVLRDGKSAVFCSANISQPIQNLQQDKDGELLVAIQNDQPVIIDKKTLTTKVLSGWADNTPAIAIRYNPQGNILYILDANGELHRFDRHHDHFHKHKNTLFVEQFNVKQSEYYYPEISSSEPQLFIGEDNTIFIFEPTTNHLHALKPTDFDDEKFQYSVPHIFDSDGLNLRPHFLTLLKNNRILVASKAGEFAVLNGQKLTGFAQEATKIISEGGEGGHHHHHHHGHDHDHAHDGDEHEHEHHHHAEDKNYVINYFSLPNNQQIIGLRPSANPQIALIFSPDGVRFIDVGVGEMMDNHEHEHEHHNHEHEHSHEHNHDHNHDHNHSGHTHSHEHEHGHTH